MSDLPASASLLSVDTPSVDSCPVDSFPVDKLLPDLCRALADGRNAVLQAPPGAGKTTRLPLALLHQPWLDNKKIIMLEPRRLAARSAANFMAKTLGENLAETVGYRIRFDTRISRRTRIEVVTEGILTRMLQTDPELAGVGLVIFDEFHERSLHADLALALCRQSQQLLREDLRILVMSATLDAAPVARLLDDAPLLTSSGVSYPVATRYVPTNHMISSTDLRALPEQMAQLVQRALREEQGNILLFLPGQGEINTLVKRLQTQLSDDVILAPLYGDLAGDAQEAALALPPPGKRKIVLATSIAETSLTIPGIRIVIDSGWSRLPVFDPVSGMSRLQTVRVSRASADQRQGRAGRLESGVCYRPWSEAQQAGFAAHTLAEIMQADLAPLVLELAAWGVTANDIDKDLAWLDAPPAAAIAQAGDLLQRLAALDSNGKITAHGKAMAELPLHPRLSHMLLKARALNLGELACRLAALLSERDILRRDLSSRDGGRGSDVLWRLQALRQSSAEVHQATRQRVLQAAKQWQQQYQLTTNVVEDDHCAGLLLAFAYPDRIAQLRSATYEKSYGKTHGRYLLANGRGAQLADGDNLAAKPYLVAAELDGQNREARVFLAAELAIDELIKAAPELIVASDRIAWSDKDNAVIARREQRLGELLLATAPLTVNGEQLAAGLCAGIRSKGLAVLPWTDHCQNFLQRCNFLHRVFAENSVGDAGKNAQADNPWPLFDEDYLLQHLETWLAPFLTGMQRLAHLEKIDLYGALKAQLSWEQQRQLDQLAPQDWQAPTGTNVNIDYSGDQPVIAVRLQEVFGQCDTPRIAANRVPLLFHLLSPARRPVAVTDDLARFWQVGYPDVKKEMKGRYPKHPWPDDPLAAAPTRHTKNRIN